MSLPDEDTLLVIDGMGVPLYAARGLTEALTLIDGASQLERTVNGNFLDFAPDWARKYALKISCTDQRALPPDNVWPGDEVVVSCVTELHRPTADPAAHEVVTGSEFVEGGNTYYRPKLTMTVIGFDMQTDEYSGDVSWSLTLEESGDAGVTA